MTGQYYYHYFYVQQPDLNWNNPAVRKAMAEITVLAESGGIKRSDWLAFLNDSVMGSMFTRYKTPAFVNLDFKATFTPTLLRKDFDLGMAQAKSLDVAMPLTRQPGGDSFELYIGLGQAF